MLKKRLLFVVSVLLPGCFSDVAVLEPRAEGIKVVRETDRPLHCDVLGKISGMSRSSDDKEGKTGAENALRNHAADLKGNFALIEAERAGQVGTSSQKDFFVGGKALFCKTEEMEDADEKAEAAARDQKEKAAEEQKAKEDEAKKQAAKDKKKGKK
jgi:hypothetical protein